MQHAGDRVVEAARRTLGERGARVSDVWFMDPPPEQPFKGRWEGVADLAAGRSHLIEQPGGALEWFDEAVARRWPWLDDEDDEEPGPREKVEAEGKVFHGFDGHWWATEGAASGRHHQGPTWILEALAGPLSAEAADGDDIRVLVEAPERVRAFVVIDDGLIRGVTWHRLVRARRAPKHWLWHRLELSDFGLHVEIATPVVMPEPDDDDLEPFWRVVAEIGVDLYRRRRAWRATHSR